MESIEPLLTTDDVANFLRVDVVTVRRLVSRNEIGAYRIGNEFRFSMDDVRAYLERQHIPAQTMPLNLAAQQLVVARNKQGLLDFTFRLRGGRSGTAAQIEALPLGDDERGFLEKLTGKRPRKSGLLSKLTKRAKSGLDAAAQAATSLDKPYVGTEHMLLGLLSVKDSAAAKVLGKFGVSYDSARDAAAGITASETIDQQPPPNELAMTASTKRMIELAFKQAKTLGHDYVGTEHLLLGLLRQEHCVGYGVLLFLKVDIERLRAELSTTTGNPPEPDLEPGQ